MPSITTAPVEALGRDAAKDQQEDPGSVDTSPVSAAHTSEVENGVSAYVPHFRAQGSCQAPLAALVTALKTLINASTIQALSLPTTPSPESLHFRQIQALLSTYATTNQGDWQKYAFFNPLHYVRNLVDATDEFELIVLCWGPGQRSRIHNHASSHCWLAGLQGEVIETQYQTSSAAKEGAEEQVWTPAPGGDPAVLHCQSPCPRLELLQASSVKPGAVAYINDNLCLHSVGCPDGAAAPGAVTLHLYAPPIKRATLYETQEDRVIVRKPGFYSIRGVRT